MATSPAGAGQGSAKAKRRAARLAAVQALYQIGVTDADAERVLGEFVVFRLGHEIDGDTYVAADPELFGAIVRGTVAVRGEVDRIINASLPSAAAAGRLEQLLRAILRAAVFELRNHGTVDALIILDEYVELTHAFYSGREPALVNGVLDHVARVVRPEEFASRGRSPS